MTKAAKSRNSAASNEPKDLVLFTLVHDFFKEYLPKLKNQSPKTIYAYQESFNALFDFIQAEKRIGLLDITFEMIDRKMLSRFLDYLETERGCCVNTRNHRLNRIRAFYKYAAKIEPTAVMHYAEIKKVPLKNIDKPDIIDYMTEEAVKAILAQPDANTEKGLRDQFLMVMLYDTGARIEEIMRIRVCDVRLGKTPTVTLFGKRGKIRTVPLMVSTANYFRHYTKVFHQGQSVYSEQPLFYTTWYDEIHPMHQDTARRFIQDYAAAAKEHCPDIPDNAHPHLWRHTRAMHLYQRGMDLTLISQWLGHSRLETTRIYAKADTEQKRKAIEKAEANSGPLSEMLDANRFTVSDDETLKRLYGLKG